MNDDANEKEYSAKVLVTRTYEISFSSPSKEQAKKDAETICQTRILKKTILEKHTKYQTQQKRAKKIKMIN